MAIDNLAISLNLTEIHKTYQTSLAGFKAFYGLSMSFPRGLNPGPHSVEASTQRTVSHSDRGWVQRGRHTLLVGAAKGIVVLILVRVAGLEPARALQPNGFSYHFDFRRLTSLACSFVVWTIPSPYP